jgi:hypothetical protein
MRPLFCCPVLCAFATTLADKTLTAGLSGLSGSRRYCHSQRIAHPADQLGETSMKLSKNVTILSGAFAYFLASALIPLHGNEAQVGSWAKVFSSAAFADDGESDGGDSGGGGHDGGESDHDSGHDSGDHDSGDHDSGDHDSGDDHGDDHSSGGSDDGAGHDSNDDSGPKTLMDMLTK